MSSRRQQSGVATLLVVMGLFFVVSMVAAYASRNLIFEQRTSANQYRATQAFEAAEAGLDWALGMLNGGRIDGQCAVAAAGSPADSFRQRYVPDLISTGTALAAGAPGCQLSTTGTWTCGCPAIGAAAFANTPGTVTQPAYRVRFRDLGAPYPRYFSIESRGCTSPDEACLSQAEVRGAGSGAAALVSIKAAMVPALAARPQAAITAGGSVTGNSLTSKAVNTDAASSGLAIVLGSGTPVSGTTPVTSAGSVSATRSVVQDASLAALAPNNAMFERFFGMSAERFAAQASTAQACTAPPCTLAQVAAAAAANPGRPIWVSSDLTIDSATTLGTATNPVLLVVNGPLQINGDAQITGLVYSRGPATVSGGTSLIQGAVIAEQSLTINSLFDVVYDRDAIDRIRNTQGTIVRIPGSWKDF